MRSKKITTIVICLTVLLAQVQLASADSVEYLKDSKTGRVIFIKAAPVLAKVVAKTAASSSPYSFASGVSSSSTSASSVTSTKDPVLVADKFLSNYGKAFGLKNPTGDLIPLRVDSDKLKFNHVRYEQRFKGIPVFGSEMIVHLGADGAAKSANGQIAPWVSVSTTPKLSKAAAISRAKIFWGSEYSNGNLPAAQRVSLYVVAPGLLNNSAATVSYLTYKVELGGSQPMSHMFYFVDAMTGLLRFKMDGVQRLYRKIADCTAQPATGLCWSSYTDPVSSYHHGRREGEASWGPNPNFNSYDEDTLYDLFGNLHDYLATIFGRDGVNGRGGLGNGSVTPWTTTSGNTFEDVMSSWQPLCPTAAFDGNQGTIAFCNNSVVRDVSSHEYMHGLPFYSHSDGSGNPIGMVYSGESGALNESQSDIFSMAIEKYISGTCNWIFGSLWPSGCFRNLADPTSFCPAEPGPHPDSSYSSSFQCGGNDYVGVHMNSTVVSKANYLMAQGDIFNGCTIEPIGIEKVEQILYRSVTTYYAQAETFNGAYHDQIQACEDLYGVESPTCLQVTKALQAVEMDQAGKCSGIPEVTPACADAVGW